MEMRLNNTLSLFHLFVTDSQECYQCSFLYWSRKSRRSCELMPQDFMATTDPLTFIFVVLSFLGLVLTATSAILLFFRKNHLVGNNINQNTDRPLSLAILACFASVMAFIGKPSDMSCKLREPLASACLTIAVICEISMAVKIHNSSKSK